MDTITTQPIIQKAIGLTGGTQSALAAKAKISQNAVWKLLTGKTKRPSYKTAVALEAAVDGRISRYEFMEMKQGESKEGDSYDKEVRTTGAGDAPEIAARNGGQVAPEGENRRGAHSGTAPIAH